MRWLLGLIFVLLVSAAQAACPLTGPQTVNSPYVVSGADGNCNFTFRQIGTNELTSPYPFSTTSSSATLGYGQMTLALDNWNGFATGMVVQVTYQADPTQYIIGAITALDITTGIATINAFVPNVSNIVAAGFNVQVLGGSPINGVPVWAGLSIDGTDSITNPSAQGNVVTLNIETGKAFTNFSTVYVWAPQDITTWFVGVVLSYNTSSGQMKVFVTQTPNTGNSYSTNYVSLIDTQGPAPALSGYSSTSQTLGSGSFTFTTQSGQFFPIDGQVLASCIDQANPNAYMAGQVTAYSGTSLIINVSGTNGVFGSGTCGAWSLYLTTGPTTRIPLFQQNGLLFINTSPIALTVTSGSVRDSSDTVDLVVPSSLTLFTNNATSQFISVSGAGTLTTNGTSNITGVGTNFTTFFSTAATLSDLSSQLSAFNFPAFTTSTIITIAGSTQKSYSISSISSDTALVVNGGGTASESSISYTRGGRTTSIGASAVYGVYLARKDADGSVGVFATSFTISGNPDLPSGYTYYRVIGFIIMDPAANAVAAYAQPMITNVMNTIGDMTYVGKSIPSYGGSIPTYDTRLPIGSSGNILEVSSGLPAWVSFATACTAATSSTFGCVKVDNTTITAAAGVISTAAHSLIPTAVFSATITPNTISGSVNSVNTGTGVITWSTNHGLTTGQCIRGVGTVPTGFTVGQMFYMNALSPTTFALYTTLANALADTSRVTLSSSTTGATVVDFLYSNVFSVGFSSVAPVCGTPGTTNMRYDLNLTNALATTLGGVQFSGDGIFNATPASEPGWYSALGATFTSTTLVQIPVQGITWSLSATNPYTGTWANQGTSAFNVRIWIWGALDDPIPANDNDLIERMAA